LSDGVPPSDSSAGFQVFRPPPGTAGAHTQTILASWPARKKRIRKRAAALTSSSASRVLTLGAGVRLLGYHSPSPRAARGLAILLHGWEGSADSHYILSTAITLNDAGLEIFRLNFRDHGDTHTLNPGLFHSCRIAEVVDAIKSIQGCYSARPLYVVGFSLGGNFAIRLAMQAQSAGLDIEKVVALCPVLRPHSTMRALETGFWGYRYYYLRKWRRSLLAKAASFPDVYELGDLRRFKTLTETTQFFVEQYTELPDLDSYLEGYAVTGSVLAGLSVPTRLIASADDPIIPIGDLAAMHRSEQLDVTVVPRGGHCGFLADYRLRSWADQEILKELLG